MERIVFPFTAFVNQEELKLALILLAINPKIGGLLIKGEKGTGKSAMVRALADLLPPIRVVADCPFNCNPDNPAEMCDICRERFAKGEKLPVVEKKMQVVTLPLSASIDAVVGSLDIEKVLKEGLRGFQPGILAKANRNILYIDEVNLLPDHIVDAILDAAAMGWNYVEREGVSISHPSRFILVGSMNPEEGELRPQLLDRFALCVVVESVKDPKLRAEIIRRNLEFAQDPLAFREKWKSKQEEMRKRIIKARELLPKVSISDRILLLIATLCKRLEVDGHRPDIVIAMTAKTIAAWNGRTEVSEEDVKLAAKLALSHRTRRKGLLPPPSAEEITTAFEESKKHVERFFRAKQEVEIKGTLGVKDRSTIYPFVAEQLKGDTEIQLSPFPSFADLVFPTGKRPVKRRLRYKITSKLQLIGKKLSGFFSSGKIKEDKTSPLVHGDIEHAEKTSPTITSKIPSISSGHTYIQVVWRNIRVPLFSSKRKSKASRRVQGYLFGKHAGSLSETSDGWYVDYTVPKGDTFPIALVPTIRAAALHGHIRPGKVTIKPTDLREKIHGKRNRACLVIVLDTSKSMEDLFYMIMDSLIMLKNVAWRKRDKISLVVCAGNSAKIVLQPTTNINIVKRQLSQIPMYGRTPLADGMLKALRILELEKRRNPDIIPIIIIISDGLANVPLKEIKPPEEFYDLCPLEGFADCLYVSKLIAMRRFLTVVFNPFHEEKIDPAFPYTPTWLMMKIAQITGGIYIGLKPGRKITTRTIFSIIYDAINRAITAY